VPDLPPRRNFRSASTEVVTAVAVSRIRSVLLALLLSAPGAAGVAQNADPSPSASASAATPTSPATIHRDPLAVLGTRISVQGIVMRTTRNAHPLGAQLRFLLADERGDTISAQGMAELPAVGAQVIVTGTVELDSSGTPVIGLEQGVLSVTVLHTPAGSSATQADGAPASVSAADSCSQAGILSVRGLSCALTTAASGSMPLAGGALLLVALGLLAVRLRASRHEDESATDIPLIIELAREIPAHPETEPPFVLADPAPFRSFPAERANGITTTNGSGAHPPIGGDEALPPRFRRISVPGVVGVEAAARPEMPPTAIIRDEDVVQLLPGRLEVIRGTDLDPEIRFFRVSTSEAPEITFGRASGPMYRHVQLPSPDVDSLHARLRYEDRRWMLVNLSRSSPVAVNGVAMPTVGTGVVLEDGDRIEIGSVAFRYHAGSR
jgi:hypothetical protein